MFTREITAKDVKATEKNRIRYSSKHIKHLPPGTITEFEWKDYCPLGFRFFSLSLSLYVFEDFSLSHFSLLLVGSFLADLYRNLRISIMMST